MELFFYIYLFPFFFFGIFAFKRYFLGFFAIFSEELWRKFFFETPPGMDIGHQFWMIKRNISILSVIINFSAALKKCFFFVENFFSANSWRNEPITLIFVFPKSIFVACIFFRGSQYLSHAGPARGGEGVRCPGPQLFLRAPRPRKKVR